MVMHHKNLGDINLDPRSFELVLLPLRQQVIDRVLQLAMMRAIVGGDCLPCSVSYCISVSCFESWTLVPTDHTRPVEDLHDCFLLFLPWAWNSLDSKLRRSGDVDAVQQIPQSTGGDRSFISDGLDLVSIAVHLLILEINQRSVVLIIFIFSLVVFIFFFILMVIAIAVVVVIIVVIAVAIVLR
jgi:hypothetical protein